MLYCQPVYNDDNNCNHNRKCVVWVIEFGMYSRLWFTIDFSDVLTTRGSSSSASLLNSYQLILWAYDYSHTPCALIFINWLDHYFVIYPTLSITGWMQSPLLEKTASIGPWYLNKHVSLPTRFINVNGYAFIRLRMGLRTCVFTVIWSIFLFASNMRY